MLYPHSLLWHYLWVGPHVVQLCLATILWRRGLYKRSPIFLLYVVYEGLESLTLYGMDISPVVSDAWWWRACCAAWVVEGPLKIAVVWEVFRHLTKPQRSFNRHVILFFVIAVLLGCIAILAAFHAPELHSRYPIISHVHVMVEAIYIVTCGLWLFTFLLASYSHLPWSRWDFGIALGAGVSACVHLATYGVFANYHLRKEYLLDFLGFAVYQICVVIWCYYLSTTDRTEPSSTLNPMAGDIRPANRREKAASGPFRATTGLLRIPNKLSD
jgi:hypothetical protein